MYGQLGGPRAPLLGFLLAGLLAACQGPSDAERYRAGLEAADWPTAEAACGGLSREDDRGDCLVGAMERLGRLERADCEDVPAGVWRDECVFLYAERAQRAGRLDAAFAACEETAFARECSFHLLKRAALNVGDEPIENVGAALAPYRGLKHAPDAPRLFWLAWFRGQEEAGRPIDASACPDDDCRAGARVGLFQRLNGRLQGDPVAFCATVPPPSVDEQGRPLWVMEEPLATWVREWALKNCARLRDPPRQGVGAGPDGIRPGPVPGAPLLPGPPPGPAPATPPSR